MENEGHLTPLAPLRDDLLRGDLRALYLAWLASASRWEGSSGAELIEENEAKEGDEERADAPQAATTRQNQQRLYGYYAC